ncbi:hypothetical protein SDRG_01308 [Saprolegnia diclina VS20]|uniref:Uncharacterized protein n=1 Tax=Saprolegnia diclina (strain VS20) TaxID=1156394 RepID=T0QT31_SAPDV|nr:hypothetical protein SDRG_01308 [Saprolegnia diclina VS20]EQC41334.1 hypothetical protein SDRG_01308 [Saprolegnia diclina VS20]|eukprot:XP_008605048.1 hypothetical protein SDRG_01308 [Saprolegnia diclina VS20]
MTGTLIQIWFNPLVVTQTWLVMLFSIINWIVVFVLEGFVFPYQNANVPARCGLATSTSCFVYSEVSRTYFLSAVISGAIIIVAVIIIYVHAKKVPSAVTIPSSHSALVYLNVPDFSSIATTMRSCAIVNGDGSVGIDEGILLIKNMLHVSDTVMTRSSNVQYELIFRFTPPCFRRLFSEAVGSILIYEVRDGKITRHFQHLYLHEMDIGRMDGMTGYLT